MRPPRAFYEPLAGDISPAGGSYIAGQRAIYPLLSYYFAPKTQQTTNHAATTITQRRHTRPATLVLRPTVFYCNPNIYPRHEYDIRKQEAIRFVTAQGLDFVDADYDHEAWLRDVAAGLEDEPERGRRCLRCFLLRLEATAAYAAEHGFRLFTTTLASSRWKSLEQINEAGRIAAGHHPGTLFWEQNWRKGGLQERRNRLLQEYGFYNQLYCGCEFSMKRLEKAPEVPARPQAET